MILNFFYFDLLLLIQSACVKVNFQVLRERGSDIASFVEHPVYSIFKMQSVLILVVLFDLSLFTQSVCIKDIYSRNFRCSAKEAVILLLSRSTPDIQQFQNVWPLDSSFLFLFTTIYPKCICKSRLFLKFQVLRERSNGTTSFVKHSVLSSLKMYSVLILLFLFFPFFCHVSPKTLLQKSFFQEILGVLRRKQ